MLEVIVLELSERCKPVKFICGKQGTRISIRGDQMGSILYGRATW